jgi:hypothetical protein
MKSAFRKALTINEVGSADTILKLFCPSVGMNEGNHEALTKTLKSISKMQVTAESDEIIIDLSYGKNIHVTEFNDHILNYILTLILMYFKENFQCYRQMHYPNGRSCLD